MATNLVRAGFDVTVYDVAQDPVNALVELGARAAASPHELGQHCDVVEIAVWDDLGVESVMTGSGAAGGVLESARRGSIVVVHSTISVATCRKLAEAARERDVHVLDAAMSGGAVRATDGSLAIMVGGDPEDFERCKVIFGVLGEDVFHAGPLGAGMAAKLCNNLMVLANLAAVTEALGIATAAGIDADTMIKLASAGTADSWALRHGFALQQSAGARPGSGSQSRMQVKDLELAVKLAQELDVADQPEIASFFLDRARRRAG
jgi:3-hydroxyisobutyrate dehydrogenase-like beta-hydroxyacid dehydrogenase